MRCVDNSELTLDRIEDTAKQIKFYRDCVKTGDWTDTFYESHLAILDTGLCVLRDKLAV